MRPLDPVTMPLEGTQLIEASAGTGKTFTIAFLFLRLIVEQDVPVEQILVVTFTRAATAELSGRLRTRLREAVNVLDALTGQNPARADGLLRLNDPLLGWLKSIKNMPVARRRLADALHGMDGAAISTIHGFCARMLQEFAFESGARLDVEVLDDERAMVRLAVEDFWALSAAQAPPQLVRHLIAGRLGPDNLVGIAGQALMDPQVPVLPALEALVDMEQVLIAIARWKTAHEAARTAWFEGGDQVKVLLQKACNDGVLHGGSYTWAKIGSWTYSCERLFEKASTGPAPLFKDFTKLTTSVLEKRTRKGKETPSHPFFAAAERLWDVYQDTRGPVKAWVARFQREMVEDVRERVAVAKERARAVSFGDLLHRLDSSLHGVHGDALAERIHARYPSVLIDEFQDTDPVQYRIFDRIHQADASGALFLIGDPKQAIYGFRGADVHAYLEAREAAVSQWTMTTNHRSDPSVVTGIAELYTGHDAPFVDPAIHYVFEVKAKESAADALFEVSDGQLHPVPPIHMLFVPQEGRGRKPNHTGELKGHWVRQQFPGHVADEVVRMLRAGLVIRQDDCDKPLSPGDVAILVRTNLQARDLHRELTERGVPAALQGDASVLDTDEADEMEALARAMAHPSDPSAVRGALATRCIGLSAADLFAAGEDEETWERWVERFQRWSAAWAVGGFLLAFRQMMSDVDAPARLLAQSGGERAVTNLLHLGELLQRVATERRLHSAGLVTWLATARADPKAARSELGQDADPIRLESDAGAVKLVTVHRAKGLEYPVVFLPYLAEGLRDPGQMVRFHDDAGTSTLDMGSVDFDTHAARAAEEELAESTRLLYVALTRAKHLVVAFWGAFPRHGSSPLGWLLHGQGISDTSGRVGGLRDRMEGLTDEALLQRLQQLQAASEGRVRARGLDASPAGRWQPPLREVPELVAYAPVRTHFAPWRVGSFSALAGAGVQSDGHDVDAIPSRQQDRGGPIVPLAAWPRGATPGTVLHGVLEVLDFQAPEEVRLATVAEALERHGGPVEWALRLTEGLHVAASVPFGPGEPALADLCMNDRLDEMAFVFPVASNGSSLTSGRLAACFADHAKHPVVQAYARRVADMGFAPLRGFLKGYIDLVYRSDGAFGVVDYKSNHLGDGLYDYGEGALGNVMAHHDYILQYHLYVLALHRYLRSRLPDYDYDRHILGARYLFLRGMVPEGGAGSGVFRDRPPMALVQSLDACVGGGA